MYTLTSALCIHGTACDEPSQFYDSLQNAESPARGKISWPCLSQMALIRLRSVQGSRLAIDKTDGGHRLPIRYPNIVRHSAQHDPMVLTQDRMWYKLQLLLPEFVVLVQALIPKVDYTGHLIILVWLFRRLELNRGHPRSS